VPTEATPSVAPAASLNTVTRSAGDVLCGEWPLRRAQRAGILLGVSLPSQKSSQLWVLMLPDDEVALDEAIDSGALGAVWESGGPGRWTPTCHESMVEALDAGGGTQAFLRLIGPEGPNGDAIQYLNGGRNRRAESNELRAGRVAFTWLPASTDPAEGIAFQSLADAALRAARTVTKPHVITHDGRPRRSIRIGAHAARWYLEHPWPDRVLRDMSTVATYRLRSEALD
jgi:hypothetical protein